MRRRSPFLALVLPLLATAAHATLLTYSESFTASGKIGSTAFSKKSVVVAITADPSTAFYDTGTWEIDSDKNTVVTVTIDSALYTLTHVSASIQDNQYGPDSDAGFFLQAQSGGLFSMGNDSPAYNTYDLQSPFGPITGSFDDIFYGLGSFSTTAGKNISFNAPTGTTTFRVVPATAPVPEPSTLALLGTGLFTLAGTLHRRLRAWPFPRSSSASVA